MCTLQWSYQYLVSRHSPTSTKGGAEDLLILQKTFKKKTAGKLLALNMNFIHIFFEKTWAASRNCSTTKLLNFFLTAFCSYREKLWPSRLSNCYISALRAKDKSVCLSVFQKKRFYFHGNPMTTYQTSFIICCTALWITFKPNLTWKPLKLKLVSLIKLNFELSKCHNNMQYDPK